MRIGQIVFIKDKNLPNVQTGIITKKEQEDSGTWWYEVLCNDGQNHVLLGHLLSPAQHDKIVFVNDPKILKKYIKNCAPKYKYHSHLITLYT